jgi:hypothetical protein
MLLDDVRQPRNRQPGVVNGAASGGRKDLPDDLEGAEQCIHNYSFTLDMRVDAQLRRWL